ncbi:hypothetical protein PoMZ_00541 [Pyricularia oryzae]|uniref:Uncharacterized protein n=1 Tax=Pyricularia oryzae TaxID=318829 RepID=A0A4P7N0A1_PYROR|nr:hypothetical protein PoMZ_00541 [Pyricularia oryzae]
MSTSIVSRTCSGVSMLNLKENGSVPAADWASIPSPPLLLPRGTKSPQIYLTSLTSSGWMSWCSAMAMRRARRRRYSEESMSAASGSFAIESTPLSQTAGCLVMAFLTAKDRVVTLLTVDGLLSSLFTRRRVQRGELLPAGVTHGLLQPVVGRECRKLPQYDLAGPNVGSGEDTKLLACTLLRHAGRQHWKLRRFDDALGRHGRQLPVQVVE